MCSAGLDTRLLACMVALIAVPAVSAQTLGDFRYLTTDDGLPNMTVSSVHQDSLGFMWFATNAGVARWDGYAFKTTNVIRRYGHNPSSGMPIWIGAGKAGEILVGGWGGLDRIDTDGRMVSVLDPANHVPWGIARSYGVNGASIVPSEPNVYWVATYGSGLFRVDSTTDSIRVFLPDPGDPFSIPARSVSAPIEDRDGSLWVPTRVGLYRLARSDMTFHKATEESVIAVLADSLRPGVLWLAEATGLSRYDVSGGHRERVLDYPGTEGGGRSSDVGMSGSIIWDRRVPGVLWIAANTAGLYRFDTVSGDGEHYPRYHPPGHRGSTPSGSASSVFQDRAGLIWVGTFGAGISYAEPLSTRSRGVKTNRRTSPAYPDFVGGYVSAVMEDSRGRWWIGNRDDSQRHLLMIDRRTGEERRWFDTGPNETGDARPLGEIFSLLEDRRGNIWTGEIHVEYSDTTAAATGYRVWTIGAIHRLDPAGGHFRSYRHEPDKTEGMPPGGIVSLHEDRDGIIWAGTVHGGIARIDPETGAVSTVSIGDYSNSAWGFLEDREGSLWVGTKEGICLVDRVSRSCELFRMPVEFALNTTDLAERPEETGVIWVGTWKGLFRFDTRTRTFSRPVSVGELTTIPIVDIVADSISALWMSTDGEGVYRYDPATGSVTVLEDRIPYYSIGAGMLDSSGDVVFGSQGRGIRVFDPHGSFPDPSPPAVLVTGVSSPPMGTRDLVGPHDVGEIRLAHANSSFSVDYVALDYANPRGSRYAYILDGLQEEWQYVGATRSATFGRLAPGSYTFRVRAANSHGMWNDTGDSLRIVIRPPWWRSSWAYAFYVFLVVAGLTAAERLQHASTVRRERHRAELRETEIRSEVAEAKARNAAEHARHLEELDEAKSRFFANVSHEFRTPLTLILGAAEDAATGRFGRLSDSLVGAVQLIVRSARRVEGLVRDILELARLDSGNVTLLLSRKDLATTVDEVVRGHMPLAERAGITLGCRVPDEPAITSFDVERVHTAVGNLISNAIKFTPSGGKVNVSLRVVQRAARDFARIEVRDTGVGIGEEDLPRVFDRFSQVDTSPTRRTEGIGIGLALVRETIELHGGTVNAESEVGFGSTFAIELPLRGVRSSVESQHVDDRGGDVVKTTAQSTFRAGESDESQEIGSDVGDVGSTEPASTSVRTPDQPVRPLVLIVEDNSDVRMFLRDHLESDFHVLEARDGEEGLREVRTRPPDLVIADVMMPRMDGIELCRAIKKDKSLGTIPVVLLTARAGEAEALQGLRAGADEYITKPFSVAQLVQLAINMVQSRARLRAETPGKITVVPSEITDPSQEEVLLGRVARVVEDHLGDSYFTVDTLADEVGLSRRQLERRMPGLCGETPSQFVRGMRLERARQLLAANVGTVSEVTFASGYRSPSRFTSAFRRKYGLSPSEYRRSVNGGEHG